MAKSKNVPLINKNINRSNELIDAKSSTNLLEEQIIAVAQARIQESHDRFGRNLYAELYPGELKKIVSDPSHISRDLKKVSVTLLRHTYIIDDDNGGFEAFNIVNNCDYKNGIFRIEFNRQIDKHLFGLKENFTTLSLSILSSFSSIYSFKIYQILKKDLWKIDKLGDGQKYEIEYNIFELRFMLGLANSDNPKVQLARQKMGDEVNYEELYNLLSTKEKKYNRMDRFKADVLEVAKKELAEKADLRFDYETYAKRGVKISNIVFTIYHNTPANLAEIISKKDILDAGNPNKSEEDVEIIPRIFFKDIYDKYVGHAELITEEDLDILITDANYDTELVVRAFEAADNEKYLSNYIGWCRAYIRAKGFDKKATINGSNKRANEVDAVMEKVKNMTTEEQVQALNRVWERTKNNNPEKFELFKALIKGNGIDYDEWESKLTSDEKIAIFWDFKSGKGINFNATT